MAKRQEKPNREAQPPEFLTVHEAAALLRIGRNQMYAAIERGEVRGVKRIGRTIRIRRAALIADD